MPGDAANMLGVRPGIDLRPDESGQVVPGTGGLSVAPGLRDLPPHLVPLRLRVPLGITSARGKDSLVVWRSGEGPFAAAPIWPSLVLRLDPRSARHGLVEPQTPMRLPDFQQRLAGTRDEWMRDENG